MRHLGTALIVVAAGVGVCGLSIFLYERGAANEIKGFVLLLMASVLLAGGFILIELRALRRALEDRNRK